MDIYIKEYQKKGTRKCPHKKMCPSQEGPLEAPTSTLSKALIMPSGMV